MYKDLVFGQDARSRMGNGVKKLARVVKSTLGPGGLNVAIQQPGRLPHLTKDGITAAKAVTLEDPIEQMAVQIIRQASAVSSDKVGDGSSTSVVLAEAVFTQGLRLVESGVNGISLQRGIQKAAAVVIEDLKAQSRKVATNEEIRNVATLSANGDVEIGSMLAEAIDKVGDDGVLTLEEGKGPATTLRVVEGFEFDRGMVSPHFVQQAELANGQHRTVFENARVWIVNDKLNTANQMNEMIQTLDTCVKANQSVIIIAPDISDVVLNTLVINNARGILSVCAVKAPGYGDTRTEGMTDLAVLTGATIRDPGHFESVVRDVGMNELGTIKRVEIYKDRTVMIGAGQNSEEEIQKHCANIKAMIEQLDGVWEKEQQTKRLARMTNGVATIVIGGISEANIKEKLDRFEDALGAIRAAIRGGILPGGGTALVRAVKSLEGLTFDDSDETFGVSVVRNAIQEPLRCIVGNTSFGKPDLVINRVLEGAGADGFDARRNQYVNMFDAGIIDPTLVTCTALEAGCEVASLLLTTACAVSVAPDEPRDNNHNTMD